jgi:hypothetical protein
MPASSIRDLTIKGDDLIAATHWDGGSGSSTT